jgi:hypothetical protein
MTLKEYFEIDQDVFNSIETSIPHITIQKVTKDGIEATIRFKNGLNVDFDKWLALNSIFRFNFDDFKKYADDADSITHIPAKLKLILESDTDMWTIDYNVIDRTRNFWGNADSLRNMNSSPKWSLLFMDSYRVDEKVLKTVVENVVGNSPDIKPTFAERVKSISRYEKLMSEILEKINTNTENISIKAKYTNGENEVWVDDGKTCTYKKFDSNGNQIEQSSIPTNSKETAESRFNSLKNLFKRD